MSMSLRRLWRLAVVASLAALGLVAAASPAEAAGRVRALAPHGGVRPAVACCDEEYHNITGTVEASPSLRRRGGPDTSYGIHGTVAYLSTVTIACYGVGTSVTATWPNGETYTTPIWDALADTSTGGANGLYVSDAWINTGGDTSTMVPACGDVLTDPSLYPWPNVDPNIFIGDGHGYFEGECVSFAAWEVRSDQRAYTKSPDFLHNAYQWTGVSSSSMPHVGDVAQWDPNVNGAGGNGHVAVVEAIYYDTSQIRIWEYNWIDSFDNYTGHRFSVRTISWAAPSRYLQF